MRQQSLVFLLRVGVQMLQRPAVVFCLCGIYCECAFITCIWTSWTVTNLSLCYTCRYSSWWRAVSIYESWWGVTLLYRASIGIHRIPTKTGCAPKRIYAWVLVCLGKVLSLSSTFVCISMCKFCCYVFICLICVPACVRVSTSVYLYVYLCRLYHRSYWNVENMWFYS